jgi:hypothetical protein
MTWVTLSATIRPQGTLPLADRVTVGPWWPAETRLTAAGGGGSVA